MSLSDTGNGDEGNVSDFRRQLLDGVHDYGDWSWGDTEALIDEAVRLHREELDRRALECLKAESRHAKALDALRERVEKLETALQCTLSAYLALDLSALPRSKQLGEVRSERERMAREALR
jgi:hypothetical protein